MVPSLIYISILGKDTTSFLLNISLQPLWSSCIQMVSFGTMSLYSWSSGRNCWQNTRTITPLRYTACLGGKESRKSSMCCSSPICRWELPVLRWWSSCLLFWILCFILKVVQCFYFIEQYQYVCAQWNCPKLQLQNNEKDRIFLQSLQMLQNQGKNKVVSFSFKIMIHGKNLTHCTADKFMFP